MQSTISTIPALLRSRTQQSPQSTAHWTRDASGNWTASTWDDYSAEVSRLAAGLHGLGLTAGTRVVVMAPVNRQWDVVQLAILACGGVVIGIDPHDTAEHIFDIMTRATVEGLVLGNFLLLEKIDVQIRKNMRFVVALAESSGAAPQEKCCHTLSNVLATVEPKAPLALPEVGENDPATIIFTSGTTGKPKGIQYTHGQVTLACQLMAEAFGDIRTGSNMVCWLPLSNLYQRMINFCAILNGASTYFVENPREIVKLLPQINPHIFLGVPRFYEKLYAGIQEKIAGMPPWQRALLEWAVSAGDLHARSLREEKPESFWGRLAFRVADRLFLSRIRQTLGSNLKYMISGSAPMPKWLLERFHAMGILILEAYGISENIVPIAANRPGAYRFGTVGTAFPGNEIAFAEDGELLVRGPGVFAGYYNDAAAGRAFNPEGYLLTGDFVKADPEGFLTITGRKSEIFKTSTGRRVAPVDIESRILRLPYVEHAVVFGAGKQFLVALLSINRALLSGVEKVSESQLGDTAIPSSCQEALKTEVRREVEALPEYLRPAGLLLTCTPLSVEAGELTANFKLRRKAIETRYADQLAELYGKVEQAKKDKSRGREIVIHCP